MSGGAGRKESRTGGGGSPPFSPPALPPNPPPRLTSDGAPFFMAFPSNSDIGATDEPAVDLTGVWGVRSAEAAGSSLAPGVVLGDGAIVGGDAPATETSKLEDGSGKLEVEYIRHKRGSKEAEDGKSKSGEAAAGADDAGDADDERDESSPAGDAEYSEEGEAAPASGAGADRTAGAPAVPEPPSREETAAPVGAPSPAPSPAPTGRGSGRAKHGDRPSVPRALPRGEGKDSRRGKYDPLWTQAEAREALEAGELLLGKIRINGKKREQAYVIVPGLEMDILVDGLRERNRVLNGDVVAVELSPADAWEEKRARGGASSASETEGPRGFQRRRTVPGGVPAAAAGGEEGGDTPDPPTPLPRAEVVADPGGEAAAEGGGGDGEAPAEAEEQEAIPSTRHYDNTLLYGSEHEAHRLWRPRFDVVRAEEERREAAKLAVGLAGDDGEALEMPLLPSHVGGVVVPYDSDDYKIAIARANKMSDGGRLRPTGRVRALMALKHTRVAVGLLRPMGCPPKKTDHSSLREPVPHSDWNLRLEPLDDRVPFVMVSKDDAPEEFLKNPWDFKTSLFKADVSTNWRIGHTFPQGKLGGLIGKSGQIAAEEETYLIQNDIKDEPFSDEINEEMLPFASKEVEKEDGSTERVPWRAPAEEIASRRDFREHRVFTIDPTTARDLDDALHIKPLGDGLYELGVHIADVSYFVKPQTNVDTEARDRCTSTYLVGRVIPMLPRILCEEQCSLNPNVERLSFSCTWVMKEDGTMAEDHKPWFGRGIIRSCCKLDYPTAQSMIEGDIHDGITDGKDGGVPEELWEKARRPSGGHSEKGVVEDVLAMNRIAVARRAKRFANGALSLHRHKLRLRLGPDDLPTTAESYPIKDSNRLIEEYMLMANYLVAEKLSMDCGDIAVLRMHPPPLPDRAAQVVELARALGIESFQWEDAGTLHDSLQRIGASSQDVRLFLETLAMGPMQSAQYFCTGDVPPTAWAHYALAIPYYTHFTSPIRRYADVMVHRLLQASLDGPEAVAALKEAEAASQVKQQCARCNERKEAAKKAGDDSAKVYMCVYLQNHPTVLDASVHDVRGSRFAKAVVPEWGIESRLEFERFGAHADYDEESHTVTLRPMVPPDHPDAKAAVDSLTPEELEAMTGSMDPPKPGSLEWIEKAAAGGGAAGDADPGAAGGGGGGSDPPSVPARPKPYPLAVTLGALSTCKVQLLARTDTVPISFEAVPMPLLAWRRACPPERVAKQKEEEDKSRRSAGGRGGGGGRRGDRSGRHGRRGGGGGGRRDRRGGSRSRSRSGGRGGRKERGGKGGGADSDDWRG